MRICLLECGDRGTGTLGRRAQTRPDRASCRVLECSAIRSVRPSAWLRRQERLRRVKPSTNALLAFGGMTSTGGDGAEECFLSARPIVLSLARSTMPSSTTLFSNNRKVQRARPLGGLEQAKAISLA